MILENKSVLVLGDSITEGSLATKYENAYHQIVAKTLGFNAVVDGIGGTRIAKQHKPSQVAKFDNDFLKRLKGHNEKVDFTIVFGGVNDFGHGDAPFGNYGDTTEETFCGCCYLLCKELKEKYGSNVMFILPMRNIYDQNPYGEFGKKPVAGKLLKEYALVIKMTAEKFGIKVLDLWEDSKLNPNIEENAKYFGDGLHPTDLGHKVLADRVIEFIKNL